MSDARSVMPKKCPTGIAGFDEISDGGLPFGRSTLVVGYSGTGKTLFALEFILHGIEMYQDPGVFVTFEETAGELMTNVASLGFELHGHIASQQLAIVSIALSAEEIVETGDFDLDGLFFRIEAAIEATKARRIVLDAVENLFSAFGDLRVLRSEFRRLLAWLRDRGLSALITTERGTDSLSRRGVEEYLVDCVVLLDNRVDDDVATRRLRITKFRGSSHSGDAFPFVLDRNGFSVLPVTSAGMNYRVSTEKISSGIEMLDEMLSGGLFRGSSMLVSGAAGTGKSSAAAHMVDAACRRGERCLYVALEESPDQIARNMRSIGLDLEQWKQSGTLMFQANRPTSHSLEAHLAELTGLVKRFQPSVVVIDPIMAYSVSGDPTPVKLMLIRAVDLFKSQGITSMFTALTAEDNAPQDTSVAISPLVDIWILLRNLESAGERTRGLYVGKARGIAHSNQIREFLITDNGVKLMDILISEDGRILTGSARKMRESMDLATDAIRNATAKRNRERLDHRRELLEAQIESMRAELADEIIAFDCDVTAENARVQLSRGAMIDLARLRGYEEPNDD